jgi:hypothetical protein
MITGGLCVPSQASMQHLSAREAIGQTAWHPFPCDEPDSVRTQRSREGKAIASPAESIFGVRVIG